MRYYKIHRYLLLLALGMTVLGFALQPPGELLRGLGLIFSSQDVLITDYFALAGVGPTLCNAAAVLALTVGLLRWSGDPPNGFTYVAAGLMTGFALFGKNVFNILPIIFGTFLYARTVKESFAKHINSALAGTSLAPIVSFVALENDGWGHPALAIAMGLAIGFIISPVCAYTFRIQNGMNLYNGGFACGLIAMILVPLLSAMGLAPTKNALWATGMNGAVSLVLFPCFAACILGGLIHGGGRSALLNYWRLLNTSGRAPSDFLRMFGGAPVMINMGVNGILATGYILLIGGDLNGPTIGGILTIVGFSAYGKHAFNFLPVMAGVYLGASFSHWSHNDPSLQLAALFCTTLAPISGYFGPLSGVGAGFLHSAVVLFAGSPAGGVNLYNNGFSGGIIAIVLYPVLMTVFRRRNPELQNKDYFETFLHDEPVYPRYRYRFKKKGIK